MKIVAKESKFKRAVLWLPARIYELAVRIRIAAYETGYLKQKKLDSVVISIGNITVGGTGKTPFVEYVARYLSEEGYQVAVLTRGYGRLSEGRRVLNGSSGQDGSKHIASQLPDKQEEQSSYKEFGDEPLMLAYSLPNVPIVIDENRIEAGLLAQRELDANALILDDGFQHLKLYRDLNLLLVDATDPFGGFEMLPFGKLREPLYALKRADAVIVTRADKPFDQAEVLSVIRGVCGVETPVLHFYSAITGLRHFSSGENYDIREFKGWNVGVMCGIGNPEAFSDDVLNGGLNIVSESFFRDHHPFTQSDLDSAIKIAREGGADALLTTAKDAVRLDGLNDREFPVYVALSELRGEDEVRLKSLLLRTLVRK